jgi:serine/arginine repetitive matrix protein 2
MLIRVQVKNHFLRQKKDHPEIEREVEEADIRRARNENVGPPPDLALGPRRRYESQQPPATRILAPHTDSMDVDPARPKTGFSGSPPQQPPTSRYPTVQQTPGPQPPLPGVASQHGSPHSSASPSSHPHHSGQQVRRLPTMGTFPDKRAENQALLQSHQALKQAQQTPQHQSPSQPILQAPPQPRDQPPLFGQPARDMQGQSPVKPSSHQPPSDRFHPSIPPHVERPYEPARHHEQDNSLRYPRRPEEQPPSDRYAAHPAQPMPPYSASVHSSPHAQAPIPEPAAQPPLAQRPQPSLRSLMDPVARTSSPPAGQPQSLMGREIPRTSTPAQAPSQPSSTPKPAEPRKASSLMSLLNPEPAPAEPKKPSEPPAPQPSRGPSTQPPPLVTNSGSVPPLAREHGDSPIGPGYPPRPYSQSTTPSQYAPPSARPVDMPRDQPQPRDSWIRQSFQPPTRSHTPAAGSPHPQASQPPLTHDAGRYPPQAPSYRAAAFAPLQPQSRGNPSPPPHSMLSHSRTSSYSHSSPAPTQSQPYPPPAPPQSQQSAASGAILQPNPYAHVQPHPAADRGPPPASASRPSHMPGLGHDPVGSTRPARAALDSILSDPSRDSDHARRSYEMEQMRMREREREYEDRRRRDESRDPGRPGFGAPAPAGPPIGHPMHGHGHGSMHPAVPPAHGHEYPGLEARQRDREREMEEWKRREWSNRY